MPNTNIVIIEGHAGKDAELRYTASGSPVANVSVATSTGTGDKERTEWHRIVAWGSQAEELGTALKGWIVSVKGRIQTREYEDKQGVKKYITEIIADALRVQKHKKKDAESAPAQPANAPTKPKGKIQDMEDDIPF